MYPQRLTRIANGLSSRCRLTVYPEVVLDIHKWTDSSKGRYSPAAATLRLADSHGLVRGSSWCPGLLGEAGPASPSSQHPLAASSQSSAAPREHPDNLAGISTPADLARQHLAGAYT